MQLSLPESTGRIHIIIIITLITIYLEVQMGIYIYRHLFQGHLVVTTFPSPLPFNHLLDSDPPYSASSNHDVACDRLSNDIDGLPYSLLRHDFENGNCIKSVSLNI
jgi:hypothetical protein